MADPAFARPRMDPDTGVRDIPLRPQDLIAPVTAARDLFVIAHLGIPRVEPLRWSLTIDGLVHRGRTLDLAALKALPRKVVESVHQCCGSPLEPAVPTRRIANVRWGGVDLAALLDAAGIDPRATFIWAYGLDRGEFAGVACDWYVKDLPRTRLAAGDVLIADELNDAPLTAEHGFPARLVVPGYYGTNSVKWLWRLHLADRRAPGPFTTRFYNDPPDTLDAAAGLPPRRPVWALAPESVIVTPAPDSRMRVGDTVEIAGWASSFRGVARVMVSADGGTSFARAALAPRRGWAWQRFSLAWRPGHRGTAELQVLAIEEGGRSQPAADARNAMHTVRVSVE
jgi:DMSO/TMAO reductase YedYZ molybdopterin-dependent catalytic subunit